MSLDNKKKRNITLNTQKKSKQKEILKLLRPKLSQAEIQRNLKLNELQIQKQVLKRLKSYNKLGTSVDKLLNKKNTNKKKSQQKNKLKSKKQVARCYSECKSIDNLQSIAKKYSEQIGQLLIEKQKLIQNNQKLRFYSKNMLACRQAYFIEEKQKKNIQIDFLQLKLDQKSKNNKNSRRKFQKMELKKIKKEQKEGREKKK